MFCSGLLRVRAGAMPTEYESVRGATVLVEARSYWYKVVLTRTIEKIRGVRPFWKSTTLASTGYDQKFNWYEVDLVRVTTFIKSSRSY